ncbi:ethylbenzene dehydrogenase-related protein [Salinilacihabitans rarus]|uniref:ethylbenzene dehydrogenase-related protein n=1 Tax=Salinilacihabitans rarus TaxID=2961596 RepID=UPI0020C8BACF|nr:ethylbenzene dehydrogenase-related protein [Salinilacihabitans rarus]
MTDGGRARGFAPLVVAVAVCLVAFTVLVPTLGEGRPANEIALVDLSDDRDPASPTAEAWDDVPTTDVPMASAQADVPNAEDVTVESVAVEAASTDDRLYLRLSWNDSTVDDESGAPEAFADAVAVQLPTDGTEQPPITMGGDDNTVNVWYWNARAGGQELLAGGPGTTTALGNSTVETEAVRDGDRWRVVFVRDRTVDGADNRTAIGGDRDVDVSLAAWNGSNAERAGQKSVSEWYYLPFGPGPAGPPYEAILWTVAGLAVAVVIAVTILGVRRT